MKFYLTLLLLVISIISASAHGGELKVETREGEGSDFIMRLPTN